MIESEYFSNEEQSETTVKTEGIGTTIKRTEGKIEPPIDEKKYGVDKPKRILIKAKIIHEENKSQ